MQWNSRRSVIGLIDLLEFHCYEVLKESCSTSFARFISLIHQKKDNQNRTKTFPEAKAKKGAWIPAPFLAFSTVNTETHGNRRGASRLHADASHALPLRPWFWKLWCLKLATRHLQMMRCKEPTQAAVRCCSRWQQVHLTKKKVLSLLRCDFDTSFFFVFGWTKWYYCRKGKSTHLLCTHLFWGRGLKADVVGTWQTSWHR